MHQQEGMESSDGFLPLSPFSYLHDSKSIPNYSLVESRGNSKSQEGVNHHQRCSSESFLIEEQPSWLDDLLNDSENIFHRGHRRSASDSYAYLGEAAADESEFVNAYFGGSTRSQSLVHYNGAEGNSQAQKINQETEGVSSTTQILDGSDDKAVGSQVKNSGPKRAKQHNTHRSRVRKLQYTAHLERTLEILKAEGSEVSAELEFVEQQNIILTLENRALRQRLESISQEQIIKNWEQGMLEREIGRLQSLYHLHKQQQQQMQIQHHQQLHSQHSKQRRNRSRDLDHQVNNTSTKNKDAISTKDSVNGPSHI